MLCYSIVKKTIQTVNCLHEYSIAEWTNYASWEITEKSVKKREAESARAEQFSEFVSCNQDTKKYYKNEITKKNRFLTTWKHVALEVCQLSCVVSSHESFCTHKMFDERLWRILNHRNYVLMSFKLHFLPPQALMFILNPFEKNSLLLSILQEFNQLWTFARMFFCCLHFRIAERYEFACKTP